MDDAAVSLAEHAAVLEAVSRNDAEAARNAMAAHIRGVHDRAGRSTAELAGNNASPPAPHCPLAEAFANHRVVQVPLTLPDHLCKNRRHDTRHGQHPTNLFCTLGRVSEVLIWLVALPPGT